MFFYSRIELLINMNITDQYFEIIIVMFTHIFTTTFVAIFFDMIFIITNRYTALLNPVVPTPPTAKRLVITIT